MGLLRLLLALTVVITHSTAIFGFELVGGQLAVQSFYIISGFYMTLILNEKYVGKKNSYRLFISNRLLRLFPVYWTILALTVFTSIAVYIIFHGEKEGTLRPFFQYAPFMSIGSMAFLIFTNIFLFLQDMVLFLGLDLKSGGLFFVQDFRQTDPKLYTFMLVPQAWTVGLEISFYLIAPFLVRRKVLVILGIIALSLSLRAYIYFHLGFQKDPWSYRFFPTELVFFLFGTLSYHIYKKIQPMEISKQILMSIWLTIVCLTLLFSFIPGEAKIFIYIVLFFLALPFIFKLTKQWKFDYYIGDLSYPIYISHVLLLLFMHFTHFDTSKNWGAYAVIASIAFSMLLNRFIQKPIEKIRQRRVNSYHETSKQ